MSGTKECTSSTEYKVCQLLAGCPVWSASYSCGANSSCDDGLCINLIADVTLIQPSNGSSSSDATPFFDWTDVTGADLYHLQVASSSSFEDPYIDDKRPDSSFTPSGALDSGVHYWRVRAATGTSWGQWSATWSFEVLV